MISLRESLKNIGEPKSGRDIPSFPSGFHSTPKSKSLRLAMNAMSSPNIENWKKTDTREFDNKDWTVECQGITTDKQYWYISNNNISWFMTGTGPGMIPRPFAYSASKRGIYKFTLDFQFMGFAEYPLQLGENSLQLGDHLGSLYFYEGKIYAGSQPFSRIAIFDTSPAFLGHADLKKGNLSELPQSGVSWCAFNPWDSYLYSSLHDNTNVIHAYDPKNDFNYVKSLALEGGTFSGVQSGVFSENGHLYLALDDRQQTQEIRAFSMLNGAFLGKLKLDYTMEPPVSEEMEGITILPMNISGNSVQVHVVILDNDGLSSDDVQIMHFTVPDPNTL